MRPIKTTQNETHRKLFGFINPALLSFTNTPWFNVSFALFWIAVSLNDYFHHCFSWEDGTLVILTCISALLSWPAVNRLIHKP